MGSQNGDNTSFILPTLLPGDNGLAEARNWGERPPTCCPHPTGCYLATHAGRPAPTEIPRVVLGGATPIAAYLRLIGSVSRCLFVSVCVRRRLFVSVCAYPSLSATGLEWSRIPHP